MDRRAVLESVAVGPRLILITHPWMLQFGGHHLTLNIAIAVRQGALTPTLTGAQPAAFKLNVKTIRPREGEQQGARLIAVPGREAARPGGSPYSPYTVADLVLEPGQDDKKIAPEGFKGSETNVTRRPYSRIRSPNGPASSAKILQTPAWLR